MRILSGLCICAAVVAAAGLPAAGAESAAEGEVVVYTSTDQVEARRVFDAFQEATGIEVKPVFDTEAQKTTGLAMRLLAEKERPVADVFWNNELSRTLMLIDEGVFEPYLSEAAAGIPARWKDEGGMWTAFSWRARVIVYNTEMLSAAEAPQTLEELTHEKWRGKVSIANPLFGTTASHTAALACAMGEEAALEWFRRLAENGVRVYEGNSVVRDAVANGEIPVGLTDTDDVLTGKSRGMKIDMVFPDQGPGGMGTFIIPNSLALVKGAPHPAAARRLVDFLLCEECERMFSDPERGQFPVRPAPAGEAGVPRDVKAMEVDWEYVSRETSPLSRKAEEILR